MAVVAIVKAVANDRSLWLSNCALAGVASIAVIAIPDREEMGRIIFPPIKSPSPALREREGPIPGASSMRRPDRRKQSLRREGRWEGEGLLVRPSPDRGLAPAATLSRIAGEGVGYSLSSRRALPFSNFSRSSAHSGRVLIHSAPGGLSMNG